MNLNSTDTKQIRKFGLIALIFFGCLCALGIWMEKSIPTYFFGTLSAIRTWIYFISTPIKACFYWMA